MAAHRYWAARTFSTQGGGNLALTEFQLLDGTATRIDAGATVTSTVAPNSGSLTALGDGSLAAAVAWTSAQYSATFAIKWDLGGGPAEVAAITLGGSTAATFATRIVLFYSDDNDSWFPALVFYDFAYPGDATLSGAIAGGAFRVHVMPGILDILGDPSPTEFTMDSPWARRDIDIEFGGRGTIAGTLKVKGSPNTPIARRVRLLGEPSGVIAREAISDAVTGAYGFTELSMKYKYSVLAYDYAKNYRAVVADNIAPELAA